MQNHLNYFNALESFHEKLRLTFYPKIFDEDLIEDQDWESMQMETYTDHRATHWFALLPIVLLSFVFLWGARFKS